MCNNADSPFTAPQELAMHYRLDRMIKDHLDRTEKSNRIGTIGAIAAISLVGVVSIVGFLWNASGANQRQADMTARLSALEKDLKDWEATLSGLKGEDSASLVQQASDIRRAWDSVRSAVMISARIDEIEAKFASGGDVERAIDGRVAPLFTALDWVGEEVNILRARPDPTNPANAQKWVKAFVYPGIRHYKDVYSVRPGLSDDNCTNWPFPWTQEELAKVPKSN